MHEYAHIYLNKFRGREKWKEVLGKERKQYNAIDFSAIEICI